LRSNLRGCSDGFEIPGWDGQAVGGAFALDYCDREVISHVTTTGGITGEMVRPDYSITQGAPGYEVIEPYSSSSSISLPSSSTSISIFLPLGPGFLTIAS